MHRLGLPPGAPVLASGFTCEFGDVPALLKQVDWLDEVGEEDR